MIFMGVGQDNTEQVFLDGKDKFNIRHDDFNTRCVGTAKSYANINDNPFSIIRRAKAKEIEIHPNFATSPQWQKYQFVLILLGHNVFLFIEAPNL